MKCVYYVCCVYQGEKSGKTGFIGTKACSRRRISSISDVELLRDFLCKKVRLQERICKKTGLKEQYDVQVLRFQLISEDCLEKESA